MGKPGWSGFTIGEALESTGGLFHPLHQLKPFGPAGNDLIKTKKMGSPRTTEESNISIGHPAV